MAAAGIGTDSVASEIVVTSRLAVEHAWKQDGSAAVWGHG